MLFAGGSFWQIFPLRGLTSDDFAQLTLFGKIKDYLWHIVLPVSALTLGAFATTTFLTKNAFIDEIRKQYVITARMKGLTERRVLYGHVFRNAMLIVDFRLSRRLPLGLFHRLAADRDDFLARRPGASVLRIDAQPRLSGGLRQSLYFRSARPGHQSDLRPDLCLDRPAHRFRNAGDLMLRALPDQPAPARSLQAQQARLFFLLVLPYRLRPVARGGIHRQRQADPGLLQGRAAFPRLRQLPGRKIRRLPRRDRLSRPGDLQGNRGPWLDDLAAGPLCRRHP